MAKSMADIGPVLAWPVIRIADLEDFMGVFRDRKLIIRRSTL
jgi:hypothetical protein